ncbi:hypothetical protein ABZ897_55695 [Nonomuraea sp. NPDC046802]|uniref:hypothetical protein n=1 Tax=Nonomuraea sp. NPDC046802 TaxID=3154919 RepID=UPI0034084348
MASVTLRQVRIVTGCDSAVRAEQSAAFGADQGRTIKCAVIAYRHGRLGLESDFEICGTTTARDCVTVDQTMIEPWLMPGLR